MITSDLSHFISGYRYTAPVANQFSNDLTLILQYTKAGDNILIDNSNEEHKLMNDLIIAANHNQPIFRPPLNYNIVDLTSHHFISGEEFYSFTKIKDQDSLIIKKIITSAKSQNADRLYQYSVK